MKTKVLTLTILMGGITLFSSCSDQHSGTIPDEAVLKAFDTKYPGVKQVEWETKHEYKVAEFKNGSYETEAWFDISGNWAMTETDIPYSQLPQAVQTSFKSSEYTDWKVEDVDKLERPAIETLYIIEVEKGEAEADLHYTQEGVLVKIITDKDNNENEYLPGTLPEAIQTFLTQKYPGYVLLDFDREAMGIEVDIMDGSIHKEVLFNSTSEWISTEWEIRQNQLPELIANALKNSEYAQYRIDDIDIMEKPAGLFYVFELEQGNKKIIITIDSNGTILK